MTDQCSNCRYWCQDFVSGPDASALEAQQGECVRYAPVARPTAHDPMKAWPAVTYEANWPVTLGNRRCGEFRSKFE